MMIIQNIDHSRIAADEDEPTDTVATPWIAQCEKSSGGKLMLQRSWAILAKKWAFAVKNWALLLMVVRIIQNYDIT